MPRQLHFTPETPASLMNAEIARFTREIAKPADPNQERKYLQRTHYRTTSGSAMPDDPNQVPDTDESQHIPFIKALCQAFQAKVLGYYNASSDAATRLQRLAEISQTFRELHFLSDQEDFTTAAEYAHLPAEEASRTGDEGCPVGTTCIDGNCIPNNRE